MRRRFAPHQLRHAHAVEIAREGVPLNVIQRQLGHANLGITSIYLQGIDNAEIIDTVHARRAPMIPASAGLAPTAVDAHLLTPRASRAGAGCAPLICARTGAPPTPRFWRPRVRPDGAVAIAGVPCGA